MRLQSGKALKEYRKSASQPVEPPVQEIDASRPTLPEGSPDASPDEWILDVRLGMKEDGEIPGQPVQVQLSVDWLKEVEWRKKVAQSMPALLIAKPFVWALQGVILLDILLNGISAKAVYDPGCAGVAVSKNFVRKHGMDPSRLVTLTLSSADGVTTIEQDVFDEVEIKWKNTKVKTSAVVLPGAGFDVLLGMTWIVEAKVSLDAVKNVLVHEGVEYAYQQLTILPAPEDVQSVVIYTKEYCSIPPKGIAWLKPVAFNCGTQGGQVIPELPCHISSNVAIFEDGSNGESLKLWKLFNTSAVPVDIQQGQRIGVWMPVVGEVTTNKPTVSYVCVPFNNLTRILCPNEAPGTLLYMLVWKWSGCFLLDKYDVGRTGPPYIIKTLTGKPYKGYVPCCSLAAVAAIR